MAEETTYRYALIIPRIGGTPAVLLRPATEGGGWALPWLAPLDEFYAKVEKLNAAVQTMLGMRTTVLRWIWRHHDEAQNLATRAFALENHTPDWAPPEGWRWAERGEPGTDHPALDIWFAEAHGQAPLPEIPWQRPGWLNEVTAWAAAKVPLTGPPVQFKSWQLSCLLRLPTAEGDLYFKATPSVFAREAAVTGAVARRFPSASPTVVGTDPARGWLLLQDFGRRLLGEDTDPSQWESAMDLYARIQIAFAPDATRILPRLGCLDRSPRFLKAGVDELVAAYSTNGRLEPDEAAALKAKAPMIKELCDRLMAYRIPLSLEHGDFHPWNIAISEADPIVFDWTYASLSHPFFSMAVMLDTLNRQWRPALDDPALPDRLRQAYLAPWTAYEPMARLQEALKIAEVLGCFHEALGCHSQILPVVPNPADWATIPGYWLRRVLERV